MSDSLDEVREWAKAQLAELREAERTGRTGNGEDHPFSRPNDHEIAGMRIAVNRLLFWIDQPTRPRMASPEAVYTLAQELKKLALHDDIVAAHVHRDQREGGTNAARLLLGLVKDLAANRKELLDRLKRAVEHGFRL